MSDKTIFSLCSNTKPFTAALALNGVAKGRFTLDTPVTKFLKTQWKFYPDPVLSERLTFRDLVLHRHGWARSDLAYSTEAFKTQLESIEALQYFPIDLEFRNGYTYSNYGYTLLGYTVAQAAGLTWEEDIENTIFTPLKMKDSYTDYQKALKTGRLTSFYTLDDEGKVYKYRADVNRYVAAVAPASGISSSLEDMTKYLIMYSNKGKSQDGVQVLPASVIQQLSQIGIGRNAFILQPPQVPNYNFAQIGEAPGWSVGIYRGRRFMFAVGAEAGVCTVTAVVPSEGIAIAILTNFEFQYVSFPAIGLVTAIIDIALGIEPAVNTNNLCGWPFSMFPQPPSPPTSTTVQSKPENRGVTGCNPPLADYVGTYTHPAFKTFTVAPINDGLSLKNALLECKATNQVYDVFDLNCEVHTFEYSFGRFTGKLRFSRGDDNLVSTLFFPYWAWDGVVVDTGSLPSQPFIKNK